MFKSEQTPDEQAMNAFGWAKLRSRRSVRLQRKVVTNRAEQFNDAPTSSTKQTTVSTKDYSKLFNPLQYERPGVNTLFFYSYFFIGSN